MMFDKRLAITGAALAIVAATAITAALLPNQGEEVMPMQEAVSDIVISQAEQSEVPEDEYLYIMREFEGKIALYPKGSLEPELVFNQLVKHLPEYDRIQLKEGIKIYSGDELNARIEDFIS